MLPCATPISCSKSSDRVAPKSHIRGGIPCRIAELNYVLFRVLVGGPSEYMPLVAVRIFIIVSSRSFVSTADALNVSEPWHMIHSWVN